MSLRFLFAAFLFVHAVAYAAPAASRDGIAVTAVHVDPSGRAEITLNGYLTVRDIGVAHAGDRLQVKFPEYVSRKKRVYPQVVLLTRQAHEAVRQALRSGKAEAGAVMPARFAVTRFSPMRKRSALKVIAAVAFNDAVEVECKVMDGRNGPWISWPARKPKKDGPWIKQVIITDKRLKESIEQELLDRYASLRSEEE